MSWLNSILKLGNALADLFRWRRVRKYTAYKEEIERVEREELNKEETNEEIEQVENNGEVSTPEFPDFTINELRNDGEVAECKEGVCRGL